MKIGTNKECIKERLHYIVLFTKHWSKEIIVALVLAIIAAVLIHPYMKYHEAEKAKQILENNKKAVAKIYTYNRNNQPAKQGSGVFINQTGLLITNYHVIDGAHQVQAKLPSGAFYKLNNIIGTNKDYDVAILQFDAKEIPYAKILGDSDKIYAGQAVITIGSPQGLENCVSQGIISNPKIHFNGKEFIQFTAPISSGSSGGGLYDNEGAVIGVTTASINSNQNSIAQNLNFAVPINIVKDTINGKCQELTNGSPQYYYWQGILADNKHDETTAIQNYEKAIDLDNDYLDAYVALAGDYYIQGKYDLEVQNYSKAVKLDPEDYYNWYLLGIAYEDIGQYDKAISCYRKSLNIDPENKDALMQIITLHLVKGDKIDASNYIKKLMKLDEGVGKEYEIILSRIR